VKTLYSFTFRSTLCKIFLLISVLCLTSCAKKIAFPASTLAPEAKGNVKVKKDKNKNYSLAIHVENLPKPEDLTPAHEEYVVWMETQNGNVKNIGRLVSASGFLSKKLKASLETVTPFEPVRIFITAEDNAGIQYPGGDVVLRTKSF
jgi:hypothetical protein